MNILRGISVIALCTSFFYGAEGQSTCNLAWDNGTELSTTDWSFGFALDTISDVTDVGTVVLNMSATSITSIQSITSVSDSGYIFMQPALENERFTLTITDYFTQYEELETSTTIRMTVTFTCSVDVRTLELAQPLTDTNNHYPEFQNAPYIYELPMPFPSGFSVQLFGTISARDIDLTNTNISFTLNSTDPISAGFSASWLSQDTIDTKLHYAQLLTTTLLSIEKDITFTLYATDVGEPPLTSETTITISVDEENSVPSSPVFTYPLYLADHSNIDIEEANGTLIVFNQGNISLSQGVDSTVTYTIVDNTGSYVNNFDLTISEDYSYIAITLKDVTEELLGEKYVILTLTATRPEAADTGVTILHIVFPGITCETCTSCATTTEDGNAVTTVTTEAITTTANGTEATTTPGGDIDTTTAGVTVTTVTTDCPVVVTEECYCTTAGEDDTTTPSSSSESTTLASENTTLASEATTLTSESTTATSENTTSSSENDTVITTTALTPTLSFPSSIYRFDKDYTFTGVLMTQTAVASNAEGTITYSAIFDDEDLASRLTINANTADVEVTAAISPGVYTFQIIATIEDLGISTSATVVLVISALTDCDGEIVFGYALQIIELEEESAHENILPLDDNGCDYTIYSQTPNQDLFSINGTQLNTVAIDREASYFSNMSVAQVRVVIDANCPNETSTANTRSKRNTEYEVLTENIAYVRTRTIVVVIIKDVNDNAPVWSSDTPTYIGFPGYELAQLIHVPYVYQFSATDADIDENAIVTYTLPSGSDTVFYIHNTEGSLYIQHESYVEDDLNFIVIATDGTFETQREITVRKLESNNVGVLFVSGGVLEDVDDVIEELSKITGYWIRSLSSAVISESDVSSTTALKSVTRRTKRATDANTLLRLVVYGLFNNEPVISENLVSALEDAEVTWPISDKVTLDSILTETASNDALGTVSTSGYLAAIIVLSVLLFVILVAAIVVYLLFFRPKNVTSTDSNVTYENFENQGSNNSTGNHFVKSVTLSESQDHVTESTDSSNGDWALKQAKDPEKSFSENIRTFSSLKGGNDDDLVFITRNEIVADISPETSKRKSVAFKSTVEEIEVAQL